jgi:RimJ/RimL family protein N-acetyltransferase
MPLLLETDRLLIRELQPEDALGMFEMDSDPEVHKYVGRSPVTTLEESERVIGYVRDQYAEWGIGRWAVLDKKDESFLGWTGFKWMAEPINGHINFYDFGYRFQRRAWGQGIATESGRAALEYGLRTLGYKPVYAMTDPANGASRHILEKLGFRYVETFHYDGPTAWSWRPADDPLCTWYVLDLPETGG